MVQRIFIRFWDGYNNRYTPMRQNIHLYAKSYYTMIKIKMFAGTGVRRLKVYYHALVMSHDNILLPFEAHI